MWNEIRRLAREKHVLLRASTEGDISAKALLAAADKKTGCSREPVRSGDALLDGGQAQLDTQDDANTIWFNVELNPEIAAYYQAHEYAHFWLHGSHTRDNNVDLNPEAANPLLAAGFQRVEAYSPQERREREANVFARELLLPSDMLLLWFAEGLNAEAIAQLVGLPVALVHHQLGLALLAPETPEPPPAVEQENGVELDPSQAEAAYVDIGPLLVEAGPGTGKTRTLSGRVAFLLGQGVASEKILALTFSNKAAEEMRSRVALISPTVAHNIWMGTFHAFGLELLRKHGEAIGLTGRPRVLDEIDALFLLEELLPQLPLRHYRNLYEPTTFLKDILKAISRAKDELVDPARYRALGTAMLEQAATQDEALAAEKVLEVAEVYAIHQARIEQDGLLDFGDLIARTVRLLQLRPEICAEIQQTFSHILVDEYQDVNRASSVLLKQIAGDGRGLWVVGDVRQAIYRFRGAAPANMHLFEEDFPGARRKSLQINYRSQQPIINAFAALAPQLLASRGAAFSPWTPQQPTTDGQVSMEIAETFESECAGMAAVIRNRVAAGRHYHEHAVLCRSHTTLARIAAQLEQHEVPVLYLGDLFERPEIRDLLALLSLASEGNGYGLLRVARFAEYQIPLADVRALLALTKEQNTPFPQALALAHDAESISAEGKAGFQRVEQHLEGLCYGTNAWSLLVRYLFERSAYLRPILADGSVAAQQQRIAILQFIQVAYSRRNIRLPKTEQKKTFLRYIRRLEQFGEDRQFRQIPEWAAGIDAVRLMTMHGAKGLEFPAVFIPAMTKRAFPLPDRPGSCPPPVGLASHMAGNSHAEEEECLFFVSLSRARDTLYLSRSKTEPSGSRSNPSDFLEKIAPALNRHFEGEATWTGGPPAQESAPIASPFAQQTSFQERMIERYDTCPRQFFYEFGLGLSGKRDDHAYLEFHRCVYQVLTWIKNERAEGRDVELEQALQQLEDVWAQRGPNDHAYAAIYKESADGIVTRAVSHIAQATKPMSPPDWTVAFQAGEVTFTPDHIEIDEATNTVSVQRFRTGQPSKTEADKAIYRLYALAAEAAFPNTTRKVEIIYLGSDHKDEPDNTAAKIKNIRKKYDELMRKIQQGYFDPKPSDRECPRCPYYFICPAAEDGRFAEDDIA